MGGRSPAGCGAITPTATPTKTPLPTATPTKTPLPPTATNTATRTATATPAPTNTPVGSCELYPIALHASAVANASAGQALPDSYNGSGAGNFGWLSWNGDNGTPSLVDSLTPPGDSDTYRNPTNANDHTLSLNDWVSGRPGVSNASGVRNALDTLMAQIITVPVWDTATGNGNNARYRIVGFARIKITSYRLPGSNRILATYYGAATCGQ